MAHILDECINSPLNEQKTFLDHPDLINPLVSKNAFISPNNKQYEAILYHMKIMLSEGQGEVILSLGTGEAENPGLSEEDLLASKATVEALAVQLNAVSVPLLEESVEDGKKIMKVLLRRKMKDDDFVELRVAVVGNVDAGKSTLLGVLTHGALDDGRGLARQKLFRHKHELESGRTSSVSNDILGFDVNGRLVNQPVHGQLDWTRICSASAKVITFIDLAGHERYLKTTVFGMTGHSPHFAMLMVGANAGCIGMTKEHLGLSLALAKPVFVVVTKMDMCPQPVFEETMKILTRILRSPGCRKLPIVINSVTDVVNTAINFMSERICPIFCVSNVDGRNLDLLKLFLSLLTPPKLGSRLLNAAGQTAGNLSSALDTASSSSSTTGQCELTQEELESKPAEFQIDDTFSVPGVGCVVSGLCTQGVIRVNDHLLLGPDALGEFHSLVIKSVHRKRMPVAEVRANQTASFALKRAVKRSQLRKGMVLVSPALQPHACWEFVADLLILHHPTTISIRYQAMVHVGPIRQTATIIDMDREHLRTGDRASVRFRFIKQPEYLRADLGQRLVFREGKTKAVGTIKMVFPHIKAVAQHTRQRNFKRDFKDNTANGPAEEATNAQSSNSVSKSSNSKRKLQPVQVQQL